MVRKIGRIATGSVLVLAGIVMLFTPGPGILALLAGLSMLAIDIPWAARLLERAKEKIGAAAAAVRRRDDESVGTHSATGGENRRSGPGGGDER